MITNEAIENYDGVADALNGYAELYRKLKEKYDNLKKQNQWIPCEKRLPRKDETVLVYLFGNSPYLAWWNGRDWDTEDFTVDRGEEPIAWMPLPKPYEGRTE